jgi:hypothetical protein
MQTVTWFSPAGQPQRTTSRTAGPSEVAGPRRIEPLERTAGWERGEVPDTYPFTV